MALLRWETATRYYAADIYRDLLGDVVVSRCWGSKRGNLGRMVVTPVSSVAAGKSALYDIAQRRAARNYRLVPRTNERR